MSSNTPEVSEKDNGVLLKQAYSKATSRLRDERREDFERIYEEEAKNLGANYTRKPTASEKARQQVAALIAEHPELAAEFGQAQPVQPGL